MSVKTILGIALIAVGVIAFVYTTRSWDLASASVHATTQRAHPTSLPPILGAIALAGGIVVLFFGKKGVRRLTSSR